MINNEDNQLPIGYIFKALNLAASYHHKQTRKSDGQPYINHLIETADILINVGLVVDEDEIAAAILHDILEDTDVTVPALLDLFEPMTIYLLLLLTEDKNLSLDERRSDTLCKIEKAGAMVQRVKLADLCSNVTQTPSGWSEDRLIGYYSYTDRLALKCKEASQELYDEYRHRRGFLGSDKG